MSGLSPYRAERKGNLIETDLYADKSSLVVEWLLLEGASRDTFALREVERELNFQVNPGRIHTLFDYMVFRGFLKTEGVSTKKRFRLSNGPGLLSGWLETYDITRKCRMWFYSSKLSDEKSILERVSSSPMKSHVALALHAAARANGLQNTSLNTIELYVEKLELIPKLESLLELSPQEASYRVLLIQPFYKAAYRFGDKRAEVKQDGLRISRPVFNFVDLYHFPLRGREQAQAIAEGVPALWKICRELPHD